MRPTSKNDSWCYTTSNKAARKKVKRSRNKSRRRQEKRMQEKEAS